MTHPVFCHGYKSMLSDYIILLLAGFFIWLLPYFSVFCTINFFVIIFLPVTSTYPYQRGTEQISVDLSVPVSGLSYFFKFWLSLLQNYCYYFSFELWFLLIVIFLSGHWFLPSAFWKWPFRSPFVKYSLYLLCFTSLHKVPTIYFPLFPAR